MNIKHRNLFAAAVLIGISLTFTPANFAGVREAVTDINPPIREVLVYPDRALVTRSGSIEAGLKPGRHVLRFTDASIKLDPNSLRAHADSRDVVVQGVTSYIERRNGPNDPKLKELEDKRDALEERRDAADKTALRAREDLAGIERYAVYLSRAISENSAGAAEGDSQKWNGALSFLSERRLKSKRELQEAEEERARIDEEMQVIQSRIDDLRSRARREYRVVEIVVSSIKQSRDLKVSFSYVITGASWSTAYGVYLEDDGKVQLAYYGDVKQETGEDWNDVKLSLSTARPARGAKRAPITPLYIAAREVGNVRESYVESEQTVTVLKEEPEPGEGGGETGGFASVEDNAGGESLIFQIPGKVTAPSDQRGRRVTIARFSEKPELLYYRVVPGLQRTAHLAARLKNGRDFPLLAGSADAYRGSGFTGRSQIDYTPSGSKFDVGFGVDLSTGVERNVRNFRQSAGTLSSGRYDHTDINVDVANRSDETRTIVVYERVPVSDVEEVRIEILGDTTGGYAFENNDENTGILKWEIKLAPREKKNLRLHYRVKVPEGYPGSIYGN